MGNLLFNSEGTPRKRQAALKTCAKAEIICGAVALLLAVAAGNYMPDSVASLFLVIGVVALVLGIVIMMSTKNDYTEETCFSIYDDHIEGVIPKPYKKFSCVWKEVRDVRKIKMMGNEMIALEVGREILIVPINDVEQAYNIIEKKLQEMERI